MESGKEGWQVNSFFNLKVLMEHWQVCVCVCMYVVTWQGGVWCVVCVTCVYVQRGEMECCSHLSFLSHLKSINTIMFDTVQWTLE